MTISRQSQPCTQRSSRMKMHLPRQRRAAAAALAASALLLLSSEKILSSINTFTDRRLSSTHRKIALIRPIGPGDGRTLLESFDLWDPHWPCTGDSVSYQIDLILSYSQTLDPSLHPEDVAAVERIKSNFEAGNGWNGCLTRILVIENDIPAERDLYEKADEQTNKLWVNGPNEQFRKGMREVMLRTKMDEKGRDVPEYEIAFVMEADSRPNKWGWIDILLKEISEETPFAILGSKYKGHSWDNYIDLIPVSLKEHINGNAVYNLTHPLTQVILDELDSEADTYFNAIPYDYRISQMITEGSTETETEFPFPKMRDENGKPITLPNKTDKFRGWWQKWGSDDPYKASNVISNFAATNFLPHDLGDEPIVHGKKPFQPWNPKTHKITLVVSDWHEDISEGLLSNIDTASHPFAGIIVMRTPVANRAEKKENLLKRLFHPSVAGITVPLTFVDRETPDFMDICDANVKTEWFMMTNAYHHVSPDVDLLFTHDDMPRAVIPYTPADTSHCTDYEACQEVARLARMTFPSLDRVILDTDMLYHTPSRNAFCQAWKAENGDLGEFFAAAEGDHTRFLERSTPRGPTATSYLAHLYKTREADNLYSFSNRLRYGTKDAFVKVHHNAEIEHHKRLMKGKGINPFNKLRVCAKEGQFSLECITVPLKPGSEFPKSCCDGFTCGKGNMCIADVNYGEARKRGLQLSEPGLLTLSD